MAHASRPVSLERPAFLQKGGLTGAERGTAIHAFLQSVPFGEDAPDLDAEVRRQKERKLLDPDLADKLDMERIRPFFTSPVWRRIRAAKRILREESFITALPARQVAPEAGDREEEVLVQGIADLVLVFDGHAEICDYKTDASKDPDYYVREYGAQLRLYPPCLCAAPGRAGDQAHHLQLCHPAGDRYSPAGACALNGARARQKILISA